MGGLHSNHSGHSPLPKSPSNSPRRSEALQVFQLSPFGKKSFVSFFLFSPRRCCRQDNEAIWDSFVRIDPRRPPQRIRQFLPRPKSLLRKASELSHPRFEPWPREIQPKQLQDFLPSLSAQILEIPEHEKGHVHPQKPNRAD